MPIRIFFLTASLTVLSTHPAGPAHFNVRTHTLQLRNRESGTRISKIALARTDLNFNPER